ncbi:hypothetical protein GUV37_004705 [Salmonella enterica]|nr:hypothetical protein [Salmonella enterica subsp. enterica]EDR7498364.1 hypothetical protein [Salmonella enterica subsp. enterica serovar Kiambu]EDW8206982.1 hypothetical protein [Salmonella enterica subsp. enterica serovar Indiana]EEJ2251619.1 hypothetical protein [Salmonella enterica subsp. enterica serovar Thompson]EEJ6122984.1 hypothetical protein [Salmonella enterica subsp. enterica serovar Montevideo]
MVATRCDHHALLAAPVAAFFKLRKSPTGEAGLCFIQAISAIRIFPQ